MKHTGENVVRIEAEALRALADRIAGPMAAAFEQAVELMACCAGRVVVTGMGKSGGNPRAAGDDQAFARSFDLDDRR